jgi:hypothetical protein
MRIQPELEKVSKRAIGLASLAGALSWQCAKFAPDIAVDASGGMAGTAGTEVGAGAGASAGIGGVGEAGSAGAASELSAVRPERSLIESNPDALAYFTLERTLSRATAELGADVYRAYALSFAERSTDPASPGPRCDDENPSSNGLSSMNGFSLPCPAEAADLYWQLTAWKPLAVTNRFDLAPMGGETCGEQHLSFFYDTSFMGQPEFPARAYLSFAAVIENPAPDRGLEGCRPLLEFWASLGRHEYDAPDRRARALEHVFFGASLSTDNLPESPELAGLKRSAFLPMISPEHFGHAGRLQLLYFGDLGDWHFFEHALVPAQEGFVLRRPLTQSLPVAALLNEHPKREQCIDELLSSVPGLLNEDVNLLRLDIDPACFAATNSVMETTLAAGMISEPLGPTRRAHEAVLPRQRLARRTPRSARRVRRDLLGMPQFGQLSLGEPEQHLSGEPRFDASVRSERPRRQPPLLRALTSAERDLRPTLGERFERLLAAPRGLRAAARRRAFSHGDRRCAARATKSVAAHAQSRQFGEQTPQQECARLRVMDAGVQFAYLRARRLSVL